MNEHAIRRILEGDGGAAGGILRALLYVPSKLYGWGMRLRRWLYEKGVFASFAAGVPVISVGNITAGGSGKTPMVALIANHLISKGKTPGILLRGYRAAGAGGSDEAILYQKLCPGALVEVGSDRVASGRRAVAAGANVLLMDDGFQHLRLRRDLDIVLIDATSPWGGGNCIPGGLLREPPSALARARVIVLTRIDQISPSAASVGWIGPPKAEIFLARHKPARLREVGSTAALPLERLNGKEVVVLSGIARPEAFQKTLASLGAKIVESFVGNDHRHFSNEFLAQAAARAQALNAVLVTTEKDEVKIPSDNSLSALLWVLGVEQEIQGNAPDFLRIIDDVAG